MYMAIVYLFAPPFVLWRLGYSRAAGVYIATWMIMFAMTLGIGVLALIASLVSPEYVIKLKETGPTVYLTTQFVEWSPNLLYYFLVPFPMILDWFMLYFYFVLGKGNHLIISLGNIYLIWTLGTWFRAAGGFWRGIDDQ